MSAFTDSIEVELKGIHAVSSGGILPDCPECDQSIREACNGECGGDDVCYCADEPSFSWSRCESCGSTFGGDRFNAHGIITETDNLIHFRMCVDCVMFHANGDEPEDWRQHPRID